MTILWQGNVIRFSVTPARGSRIFGDDRFPEFRSAALRAVILRASGAVRNDAMLASPNTLGSERPEGAAE
ncbi:MAG: hypothetical protein DMF06_13415 [Verrucomicrobia bacterium]|nr:MAG: hypothetical protein DMF06_13415 [Verrucomicrobiota bacterium]